MEIYKEIKEIYCGIDELEDVKKYLDEKCEGNYNGWTVNISKPNYEKMFREMFNILLKKI